MVRSNDITTTTNKSSNDIPQEKHGHHHRPSTKKQTEKKMKRQEKTAVKRKAKKQPKNPAVDMQPRPLPIITKVSAPSKEAGARTSTTATKPPAPPQELRRRQQQEQKQQGIFLLQGASSYNEPPLPPQHCPALIPMPQDPSCPPLLPIPKNTVMLTKEAYTNATTSLAPPPPLVTTTRTRLGGGCPPAVLIYVHRSHQEHGEMATATTEEPTINEDTRIAEEIAFDPNPDWQRCVEEFVLTSEMALQDEELSPSLSSYWVSPHSTNYNNTTTTKDNPHNTNNVFYKPPPTRLQGEVSILHVMDPC